MVRPEGAAWCWAGERSALSKAMSSSRRVATGFSGARVRRLTIPLHLDVKGSCFGDPPEARVHSPSKY